MSLFRIAWRNIEQRSLASALTAFSMALGVALVAAVLVIHSVIASSFQRSAQGYNLIVGGKGDPLTLVLDSVFHIANRKMPTIPYSAYEELAHGRMSQAVLAAIPVCSGHDFKGFAAVATIPDYFEKLTFHEDEPYRFAPGGRNMKLENPQEAVVGATVARKLGLSVGDPVKPVASGGGASDHEDEPFKIVGILEPTGTPNDRTVFLNLEGFYAEPAHQQAASQMTNMLIGSPTAAGKTDGDKANADEHAEEHAVAAADDAKHADAEHADEEHAGEEQADHDHEDEEHAASEHHHEHNRVLTAVLVRTDDNRLQLAGNLPQAIDTKLDAMAVYPAQEIDRLFRNIIGNIQLILLILAVLVVVVAGIGILVSIYNSMSERQHDIAIMRALGAGRSTVMSIILLESILLSLGGGAVGVLMAHGLIAALGPLIVEQTGVIVRAFEFKYVELVLIPGLIALATIVGFLPAMAAYRTDVSRSLQAAP